MFPIFRSCRCFIPDDYDIPPTIYSILNAVVNYDNSNPEKIKNLASAGRNIIFDFNYPLTDKIQKDDFEEIILKHFLMRRIGYETLTAFKIALEVKLNEIMPTYNKLFNALDGWEIFLDGEVTTREQISSNSSNNTLSNTTISSNISDRRYSDTPQDALEDVKDGKYVTDYNYDSDTGNATSNSTSTGSDSGNVNETITRSPADKMKNYVEFIQQKQNIYTMIFKELDVLFYQII